MLLLYVLVCVLSLCSGRDFYVGMFKRNDYLVAQDTLYSQRRPFTYTSAKYGRLFTCPITYFRVVDRLGACRGPSVQVIRGGLHHKYLVLKVTSCYNRPISATVYVGCTSEKTTRRPPATSSDEQDTTEDYISDNDGTATTQRADNSTQHDTAHTTDNTTQHNTTEHSSHNTTHHDTDTTQKHDDTHTDKDTIHTTPKAPHPP